ncbi:hypothetical protein QBC38DRAFT_469459 [Podospora fimiseda]|uniref:Uncharacterized protein n=1 Tax=Podospora fimiseda TaxID=252190 RepID=A0AAN7BW36_9PEZI|nr:hypothetical protein QBC38DRAFT_469459 [Podospora fimiseda]
MHDNRTHPFLQQVPLTVSPFVNLPSATTLPYTYKPMPSTLPPSSVGLTSTSDDSANKPKYVISPSGHAAHPDDILASCRALKAHISRLQADAEAEIKAIDERIRARELAEKRRLAPGWLDSDVRVLEPERKAGAGSSEAGEQEKPSFFETLEASGGQQQGGGGPGVGHGPGGASEMAVPDEGAELDRAFGVLQIRTKP